MLYLYYLFYFFFFFFFKQKTAYEMSLRDWSSDVCSSDLEHHLVVRRRQVRERRATAGRDEEVAVERDGPLVRRPRHQGSELGAVPLGHRRLHDEVEPRRAQPRQCALHLGEGAPAVTELVVIRRTQRVHADRDPPHARVRERRDALRGEQRAVGPDHDRRAVGGRVVGDLAQIPPQQRLASRQDEQRGGIDGEQLVHDVEARRRVELGGGALARPRRDVAVRAFQVAALGQIPRDHVRDVIHVSLRLAPPAAAPWPPSPPRASSSSGPPGTSPSALRCPG